jgi:hypothetical protein
VQLSVLVSSNLFKQNGITLREYKYIRCRQQKKT